MADVGCRNTVFGAEAQEASRHLSLWWKAGVRNFRLEFVHETGEQLRQVVELFEKAFRGIFSFDELGRRLRSTVPGGTTEGSLLVPGNYLTLPVLQ